MGKLDGIVTFVSGSPQFRIKEAFDDKAPLYTFYGQPDIEVDLTGIECDGSDSKQIRTLDKVNTLCHGDVIFSLISGMAAIVGKQHEGYLYTQNYVKLVANNNVDSQYLVYILNEDESIKKQFQMGLQGSQVLKYTLKQLRELQLPVLPIKDKQQLTGELYFNQLRLQALRGRAAKLETIIVLEKLKEVRNK